MPIKERARKIWRGLQEKRVVRLKAKRDKKLVKLIKASYFDAKPLFTNAPASKIRTMEFVWEFAHNSPKREVLHKYPPSEQDVEACMAFLKKFRQVGVAKIVTTKHESRLAIGANINDNFFGHVRINFGFEKGKKILFIDAIQGIQGKKWEMDLFKRSFNEAWPNVLIQKAVRAARQASFSEVRLIRPEENPYYISASQIHNLGLRKRMCELYYSVAKKEGFEKAKDSKYLVLKL